MNQPQKITEMLQNWSNGDQQALEDLMPLVYSELHRQASGYLRRERANHTLQTSALVNEVYLKLVDQKSTSFRNRSHFFAIAANMMRRILVDYARGKNRKKRGGNDVPVTLDETMALTNTDQNVDLEALDEALNRLAINDKRQASVVELRYFAGMSLEETAEVLGVSRTTVAQEWAMARAWLHRELSK
ncbi:MAG: sigma-70 family RNA polymerase sigma factor [Acidobacteria bacterium]|nr:sigma-70 family RNA polymerase sigma factor [Acidobacteriota bacterium]